MRLKGTVSSIVDFGAFVDLGGIDGLVHISELSWNHVNHPSEVVKVGDEVEVEVLDVDLQRERISLGLKQTTEDPWVKLVESYPVGTIVDGKVTKIVPFGAFIELGQSIEGLVHISEMAMRHIDTPAQVVKAGDEVKVKVMEINPERRRISLSMKAAAADLGFEIEVDESIQVEEKPAKKKAEKADAFFCYWSRRRKCRLFSERRRFYAKMNEAKNARAATHIRGFTSRNLPWATLMMQ